MDIRKYFTTPDGSKSTKVKTKTKVQSAKGAPKKLAVGNNNNQKRKSLTNSSGGGGIKRRKAVPKKTPKFVAGAVVKFRIEYSVKSNVVEWDDATFEDCRPEEADDQQEEHMDALRKADRASGYSTSTPMSLDSANAEAIDFMKQNLVINLCEDGELGVNGGSNYKVSPVTSSIDEAKGTGTHELAVDFELDVYCGGDLKNKARAKICCSVVPC